MKKIGINLIIGFILTIILVVISLLVIKPNYTYLITFNDKVYQTKDPKSFSYQNEVISYKEQDNIITVTYEETAKPENKVVYYKETGRTVMACDNKIFEATYINGNANFEGLDADEIMIFYKYITLIDMKTVDNDRINVTNQKIICSILSIFIAFILSFLAYPLFLYEKLEESKKIAICAISMTVLLCISSAFYIYFTLK